MLLVVRECAAATGLLASRASALGARALVSAAAAAASVKIPMAAVKSLRDATGAPMMDCKKALEHAFEESSAFDEALAQEWLRKRGMETAAKRAGRSASEGLIGAAMAGGRCALVEVNSETDFVARNTVFQAAVAKVATAAAEAGAPSGQHLDGDALLALPGVEALMADTVAAIKENIKPTRGAVLSAPPEGGALAVYVHNEVPSETGTKMGQVAAAVALEPSTRAGEAQMSLEELAYKVAMHVVAGNPSFRDRASVPADVLAKEEEILRAQLAESGKPAHVVDKVVQGRMHKFFADQCLMEQQYLIGGDDKKQPTVKQLLEQHGTGLAGYLRFQVGGCSSSSTAASGSE